MISRLATRTARKPHKCAGCLTTIIAGEKYDSQTGHYDDGSIGTWSYHQDCRELERELNQQYDPEDGWAFLHEFVDSEPGILEGAPSAVLARFQKSAA